MGIFFFCISSDILAGTEVVLDSIHHLEPLVQGNMDLFPHYFVEFGRTGIRTRSLNQAIRRSVSVLLKAVWLGEGLPASAIRMPSWTRRDLFCVKWLCVMGKVLRNSQKEANMPWGC